MSDTDLTAFRQEIDAIDAELHALIMRRAEVSEKVRATKTGDELKLRPGREANILRALVARHKGAFPKTQLVRMWREMLSASLSMQGPFSVAVYATETAHSFWDIARDHFGGGLQSWKFGTTRRVVETVAGGQCSVGILPEPDVEDPDPWWHYLLAQPNAANQGSPLRIVAKLPFARASAQYGGTEAVMVARALPEPSGQDRSLIAIDLNTDMSTDAFLTEVAGCGFADIFQRARWNDATSRKRWVYLVEVEGYVAANDPRVTQLADVFDRNLNDVFVVGAFAVPLVLDDDARAAPKRARSR